MVSSGWGQILEGFPEEGTGELERAGVAHGEREDSSCQRRDPLHLIQGHFRLCELSVGKSAHGTLTLLIRLNSRLVARPFLRAILAQCCRIMQAGRAADTNQGIYGAGDWLSQPLTFPHSSPSA